MRPWAWGGPRRIDRPAEFGCKAQVTDNEDDEDDEGTKTKTKTKRHSHGPREDVPHGRVGI